MAKKKKGKGTKALCGALKEIHDLNMDIAGDKKASKKDRQEAAYNASQARQDGKAWGCSWA